MDDAGNDLIRTTRGLWPASGLEKREGVHEDENERTAWVEYYLAGELVHRSAHVHLKHAMFADGVAADFAQGT